MATAQKPITFTVSAPVASVIANAAQSLAVGQWAAVTASNTANADPPGIGDNILSFSPAASWDPLHKVMRAWGGLHGGGASVQRMWMSTYTDATNAFSALNGVPNSTATGGEHGYFAGPAIDSITGDVYGCNYGSAQVNRWSFASSTWDTPFSTTIACAHATMCTLVYHPGLYGGAGGLVQASNAGIWTTQLPRSGTPTWNLILDATNPLNAMGDFPIGVYIPKDGAAYVGGGNNLSNLWKVPASSGAGTASAVAYPSLGMNASSGNRLCAAGGDPAHGMVLFDKTGNVVAYDATGNAWNAISATPPDALLNAGGGSNQWFNLCSIPDYKCMACFTGSGPPYLLTSTLYVLRY